VIAVVVFVYINEISEEEYVETLTIPLEDLSDVSEIKLMTRHIRNSKGFAVVSNLVSNVLTNPSACFNQDLKSYVKDIIVLDNNKIIERHYKNKNNSAWLKFKKPGFKNIEVLRSEAYDKEVKEGKIRVWYDRKNQVITNIKDEIQANIHLDGTPHNSGKKGIVVEGKATRAKVKDILPTHYLLQ